MTPQLKRTLGLILVIISIISLIISAGGIVALWSVRPAITTALQDTVKLVVETLATTQKALAVADAALQNAADTLTLLSGSIDSLANSIGSTQNALNSVTMLVRYDLPKTIDAARTALASAQDTARVVDDFLSGLSSIQFLNINYNPDVPLNSAIGRIGTSLDGLPSQLTKLGDDLDAVNMNLPAVISTIRGLGTTLRDVDSTLSEARAVIKEYAAQLTRAQTAVQPIGDSIPTYVTFFAVALTFVALWISAVQIMVLVIGWRWLRSEQRAA
jgi:ABC-type transporter Mla subunit MlaD